MNSFLISPHDQSGERRTYPISKFNFIPKLPSNFKGNREYLIIGFDTEYQRILDTNDNEILSYQYSCMLINSKNEDQEISWNGVVLPESGSKEDRLSLTDFIGFSIGHGLDLYPKMKIPRDVFLVAHFTRADVPGFSDFKEDLITRTNLNLDNIRGSYVNVSQDIPVKLFDEDFDETITLNVKIRDTLTLAPAGARKLEDLGNILNFKKMKIASTPEDELYLKRNMKEFMKKDWGLFRDYAIRDAEICSQYTTRMIRLYYSHTNKFKLPLTLTSIGVDLLQKFWSDNGVDPLGIVGKEQVVQKYWSTRLNRYQKKKKDVLLKELHYRTDFLTECYHGGRNEQFWFGSIYEDTWYDYDLTSAYPSAMTLIGYPDWSKIREIRDGNELFQQEDKKTRYTPSDLVFAEVKFKFDDSVRYPSLPVRTETGLIFPREGISTTHISEIRLAQKLGCDLEMLHGVVIPSVRYRRDEVVQRPFKDFTKYCVDMRNDHPKKSLENLFWKELTNSTYGKTAQGLRERRIYDLKDMDVKRLEQSKITNPVYASYITAFCRGTLSEIMNNLPDDVMIFSVTTDGFISTATEDQMEKATEGTLCKYYKSARQILSNDETIFEVKHVVKRPFGWRTRGQSTIDSSDLSDWKETNKPSDGNKEDNRYILAKGGIKLDHILSKSEECLAINKLFFDRLPQDQMAITLGMGIRTMYEHGYDFVDRSMIKRLSMEYDWKRKPHFVGETPIAIDGVECKKHIFFSTNPWKSLNEYQKVRSTWEEFNHTNRRVIKTREQYDNWCEFFEGKNVDEDINNPDVSKYLSKTDGPLKRLREQLIVAHKLRKGGCSRVYQSKDRSNDNMIKGYHLKAEEFAEILTSLLGIEVIKGDVVNGRKKSFFKPHSVPNTRKINQIIKDVKKHLFPDLRIEEFLTKPSELQLRGCDLSDCKISQKMDLSI